MDTPKLILLNGAAAVGKTTIAERYATDHPLTLDFAGDVLIEMISGWRDYEPAARQYVFEMTLASVVAYLKTGHNVIVQYLLTDAAHAAAFKAAALDAGAEFHEVMLEVDKETAVRRLLARGRWGEPNSPPLTAADIPDIEALYDRMIAATAERPDTKRIPVMEGDIDGTYQAFLRAVRS
jgi:predicted kinase